MEVIYRAYDKTEFSTEKECREYEEQTMHWKMFDDNGNPTDNFDEAIFVYIDGTPGAVDHFIKYVGEDDETIEGIENDGWYFWDYSSDSYIFLRYSVRQFFHIGDYV